MTALGGVRIESRPVVGHGEQQATGLLSQMDRDLRARRVLCRVLERLETAEVDGRLCLRGVATDAIGDDVHGERIAMAAARSASTSPASTRSGG